MQKIPFTTKKFRFREFKVYKETRQVSLGIKKLVKETFPKEETFALMSQIRRALDSIVLNIAEGSERSTDKDFALFLNHSFASLNEVVACLDIAYDNKYITERDLEIYIPQLGELGNQLTAFRKMLLTKPTK